MLDWMPEQAATWSADVDWINNFITYTAVFCTAAITGAMLYFAIRYRRRPGHERALSNVHHNTPLEIFWTAVPTAVVMFVFLQGWNVYSTMRNVPANALEIGVAAHQWFWEFTYPNGKKAVGELVVPVNEPVRLIMKSVGENPVNHSLFIPALRVKEDVIGSEYHYMWFQATMLKSFPIFCAEYCGSQHSAMLATLRVVTRPEYDDYVNDRVKTERSPEELGRQLYETRQCKACHTIDGTRLVGPSFKGKWGKAEDIADGTKVTFDENYVRESILNPMAKITAGYPPAMPPQALADQEIEAIIAFLKTLKE